MLSRVLDKDYPRPSAIIKAKPRRAVFSVMTVLVGTMLLAGNALAFAPGPTTGFKDPFNPSDATPSCDPSPSPNLNSPTAAGATVAKTCTETGTPSLGPVTVNWVSDTLSGSQTDNAWGQGDKSDCFLAKQGGVDGACVTQVFGIGAAKTDLQYHGIGLAKGSDGHDYLYSGIKRLQAGGVTSSNANYNVEVNQLLEPYKPATPICPLAANATPNTGGCNMWRSPGDLTLMTDWGGNQSSCNLPTPAICAYVWIDFSTGTGKTPSPVGSTCFNAQSAPCWGTLPGGSAALSANPDKAAGSINFNAAVQPFTFSEIGVDLTNSGLVPPGACETFKNVWAHSRSSSSFSAELKDFIFGNVSISTCTGTTTVLHERTNISGAGDVQSGSELNVNAGAFVNDVASVTGTGATGSVKFKYYTSAALCAADPDGSDAADAATIFDVSTNTLTSGSATSSTVQFNAVGDFYWRAFYSGNLSASASPCDEIVHVSKATPGLTTTASGPVTVGQTITDTAHLTGGVGTLTGTIAFQVYAPGDTLCATALTPQPTSATVNGTGDYTSGPFTTTAVGVYRWRAFFTDTDGKNNDVSTPCNDANESSTVNKATPGLTTTASGPVTVGQTITDTAHLTGGFGTLTGTIAFQVYAPGDTLCATALTPQPTSATVNGTGDYTSGPFTTTAVGVYRWRAFFTDTDGKNNDVSTPCNDANESSTVNPGSPSFTTAMKLTPNDSATISNIVAGGSASGTKTQQIIFKLFNSADCSGSVIDTESFAASANGTFSTDNTTHFVTADGTWSWLVSYTGDTRNDPFNPVCTTEQFKVDFTPLAP